MLFVEIALSGLRGLPDVRVAPRPGVNVLRRADAEHRARLVDAIFHTLQIEAGGAGHLIEPGSAARAALAVQGKDGQLYRLVRDFASGGTRLMKREKTEWTPLSSDVAEISQFVRVQLHVPSHTVYERLFVLSPGRLVGQGPSVPSRGGGPLWPVMDLLGTPGSGSSSPGIGSTSPGWGSSSPGFPAFGSGPAFGGGGGSSPGFPAASSPGLGGNLGFGTAGAPMLRMQSALQPSPVFGQSSSPYVTGDLGYEGGALPRGPSAFNPNNALARSEAEPPRAFDVTGSRRELARLTKHLELVKASQGMRAELDRLLRYRETLKVRVAEVQQVLKAADEARRNAERYQHLEGVPAGTADRIKDIEASDARRNKEMERLAAEREEIERAVAEAEPKPLQRDPVFIGGIAVFVLSLVLAFALEKPGVALFNVIGAAVAAAVAWAYVGRLERASRLSARLGGLAEKEARITRQHDLETGVVRKLLAQLDIEDPADLLAELEAATLASAERAAADHRAAQMEGDPARRAELADIAKVEARIDQIEAQLMSIEAGEDGGASVMELERRIAQLAQQIARHDGGGAPSSPPPARGSSGGSQAASEPAMALWAPGADDEPRFATSGGGGGWGGSRAPYGGDEGNTPEDGTAALGAALADVVHKPVGALAQALLPRLGQYLKAFTGGAFVSAEIGPRGEIRVRASDARGTSPVAGVDPAHARAVEAAIHLAWLEAAVSRAPMPVLFDDPFIGLAPTARKLIAQALGYIGDRTQVIVLTSEQDIPGHAL